MVLLIVFFVIGVVVLFLVFVFVGCSVVEWICFFWFKEWGLCIVVGVVMIVFVVGFVFNVL